MVWYSFNRSFAEFCKERKNRPGVLVEILTSNQRPKIFLIGDISALGSVMGGACLLDSNTIIRRYTYLWQR